MANAKTILAELKKKGREKTRAIYANHGLPADRAYGVSVADMKTIAKSIKGQQGLAGELFATGIVDAMYLAGIVADGKQMSAKQLDDWAHGATGMPMISEYTVPWVTVENAKARELARNGWIRKWRAWQRQAGARIRVCWRLSPTANSI